MDKLGMKTVDLAAQMFGNTKTAGQTADVSGDFRKMLEGKNEGAGAGQGSQDSKEITKDEKPAKTEAADDAKKDTGAKETGKSEETEQTGGADKTQEDTRQAEQMLAAQLQQRLSYGFIQNAPETGAETAADTPGTTMDVSGTELEGLVQPDMAMEETAVQVQTQMPETGVVKNVRTDAGAGQTSMGAQGAADAGTAETMQVTAREDASEAGGQTRDFSSQLKNTAKTSQPENKVQPQQENYAAQQAAAAAGQDRVVRTEDVRPQGPVTVHVSQPEELPEKVTDQLLAKLPEGVREFEIHIEPANLGKIAVKVLYAGSQATISIICSEKRAMDILGQNAKEIGNIINRNLGGETTIIVEKQETDYLNQTRDENEQANQNQQKQKEENQKDQKNDDAEQFLQKLRLGLAR